MPARRWRSAACVSVVTVTSRFTFSKRRVGDGLRFGERRGPCQRALGFLPVGGGRGDLARQLGASRLELAQASVHEGARLFRQGRCAWPAGRRAARSGPTRSLSSRVMRRCRSSRRPRSARRLTIFISACAGLELRADGGGAQAGADLAFDRRTQRDQPRIDDGLGAGCLQQRAHRQPADGQHQQRSHGNLQQPAAMRSQLAAQDGTDGPASLRRRPCCCRGVRAFRRLRAASSCGRQCRADPGRRHCSRSRSAPLRACGSDRPAAAMA